MAYRIPRRQWSRRPPPNDEPVHLTPEGIVRLNARLARLKHELPTAIEEVARTSAFGDRSDNAEYKEAKGILRRMHRQIASIEDQLKRVVAIPSGPAADGKARLGSTVTIQAAAEGGEMKKYRIVGPSEADPGRECISHTSPLGAALIGQGVGDIVTIQTPRGTRKWKVLEVQ